MYLADGTTAGSRCDPWIDALVSDCGGHGRVPFRFDGRRACRRDHMRAVEVEIAGGLARRLRFPALAHALACSCGSRAGSRAAPHNVLILEQQVVAEQLNVLRRVLDLVPLALLSWAEVPVAFRPSAEGNQ